MLEDYNAPEVRIDFAHIAPKKLLFKIYNLREIQLNWSFFILPIMGYFRRKRLANFARSYPDLSDLEVLDVGGRPMIWELLKDEFGLVPKKLIILNTEKEINISKDYLTEVGNGCDLNYQDNSFDLVFSNSVIEHVGSMKNIVFFAHETTRVGREVYIQTPNRWFPIEPHLVALFIHWLPRSIFRNLGFLSLRRISLLGKGGKYYEIFDGIHLLNRKMSLTFTLINCCTLKRSWV